jgi:hypothetical protein
VPPRALAQLGAAAAEHAHGLVTSQHELTVVDRDVELVPFSDAQRMSEIGGQHDTTERVDAPRAILRAHAKGVLSHHMLSVL